MVAYFISLDYAILLVSFLNLNEGGGSSSQHVQKLISVDEEILPIKISIVLFNLSTYKNFFRTNCILEAYVY